MLRAGEGDVRESTLLAQTVLAGSHPKAGELVPQVGQITEFDDRQRRQPVGISAQVVRHPVEADGPPAVLEHPGAAVVGIGPLADAPAVGLVVVDGRLAVVGEDRLGHAGDRHVVPFQTLRGVHRQHLDGGVGGFDLCLVEAALLVLGGIEPRQKSAERRAVGRCREPRRDVGEGVEVHPGGIGGDARAGQHLDVETERAFGFCGELGERQPGQSSHPPDNLRKTRKSLSRNVAQWRTCRARPLGRRQLIDGLDQRRPVTGGRLAVGRGALDGGPTVAFELARPRGEHVEVGRTQPDQRAGQQSDETVAAGGILHDPEQAHQVGDLGCHQQPAHTDDLDRQAGLLECVDEQREQRPFAAEHRGRRKVAVGAGMPALGQPLRDVGRFGLDGLQPRGENLTRPGRRAGRERRDGDRAALAQRRRDDIGRVEDRAVVAPTGRQRTYRGATRLVGEVVGVGAERRRAGTAPAVDRLVRVADGGDPHRLARCDEQVLEQLQLRFAGVLELIQQHRLEPATFERADAREPAGQGSRQAHLVGEVERRPRMLELPVALDHRQHRATRPQRLQQIAIDGVLVLLQPGGLVEVTQPGDERLDLGAHLLGGEEVLGHLTGERHHGGDHRGRHLVDVVHRAVVAVHDLGGVLPRRRLGEHPGIGLDTEAQTLLAHEPTGVGVVGEHRRAVGQPECAVGVLLRHPQTCRTQRPQLPGHPFGQLTGGLAGEGEPEHLVGLDEPVGDQPDDPVGHRLGLARAGTRDDEHRPVGVCLDNRPLLVGRREEPESLRDRGGVVACGVEH